MSRGRAVGRPTAGRGCASGAYETIAMGCNDLSAELRLPVARLANAPNVSRRFGLFASMSMVVLAARAHNMHVLDGVFNDLNDAAGFEAECGEGKLMGFDGKTLIHPAQVDPCRAVFGATPAEIEWARRVLQEVDEAPDAIGAIVVEGKLIEELHVRRAADIVAAEEHTSQLDDAAEAVASDAGEQDRMFRSSKSTPKRQSARQFDYLKNEKWERRDEERVRMPPR